MSNYTAVLGKIHVPLWTPDDLVRSELVNSRAIQQLPEETPYPYLGRAMFARTPKGQSYRELVYHFAATMKGVEEEWEEWVAQFEALLHQMCWNLADVHLETEYFGDYHYHWFASEYTPGQPVADWTRSGGPWTYAEFLEQPNSHRT